MGIGGADDAPGDARRFRLLLAGDEAFQGLARGLVSDAVAVDACAEGDCAVACVRERLARDEPYDAALLSFGPDRDLAVLETAVRLRALDLDIELAVFLASDEAPPPETLRPLSPLHKTLLLTGTTAPAALRRLALSLVMRRREEAQSRQQLEQARTRVQEQSGELARANAELLAVTADRTRTQMELRGAEERFQVVAQLADEGMLTHYNDRIVDANPAAETLFGYAPGELAGKPLQVLFPPDAGLALAEAMRGDGGRPYSGECRRKDRSAFEAEAAFRRFSHRGKRLWLTLVRDVTAVVHARAAVRERERYHERLMDIAPVGLVVIDPRNRQIVDCNAEAARMMGLAKSALLGRKCQGALCGHDADECPLCDSEGGTIVSEELLTRSDGTQLPIYKSAVVITHQGRRRLIESFIDITERKRAELDRAELQAKLEQSQKLEALGRLAGGVAHDFNNLLTVIQGCNETLAEALPRDGELWQEVVQIGRAARQAAELTGQLLAFGRKQAIAPRVIDLNLVVADALKMVRRLIGEDIDLAFAPAPAPVTMRADAGQISQALINLAVNARDAMPEGGRVSIEVGRYAVLESGAPPHPQAPPGEYARLTVADNGVGMSEHVRERVFEPFFTTKDKGKGTGLGLATVYGIVKQHDGYVYAQSAPDKGSTFVLYFPWVDAPAEPTVPEATGTAPRGEEAVLLVEDEDMVRELTRRALERQGYTVLSAPDGPSAIQLCEREKAAIDLLLTDVIMPNMNGKELHARLSEARPNLRVLFMSGYPADIIGSHGMLEAGAAFLQKPFTIEALARRVRETLDRGRES
jgi:PAS domain S-box-containing protein